MKHTKKIIRLTLISSTILLGACSEAPEVQDPISSDKDNIAITAMKAPVVIEIGSLNDLEALFKLHDYTIESWAEGNREVPRLSFDEVSDSWKEASSHMPVKIKKQIFFRLMAPLILISNERILLEREEIRTAAIDSQNLKELGLKYRVLADEKGVMDEEKRARLLIQVDIIPPSLALAQAAEESGWGTSRFTTEGNAFFGQWDFSGNGMTPKQQRKELGDYGLARFDSPLASVEGYMKNINTTGAYEKLRLLRANLRKNNKDITGMELANTLDKYSERGQAYIDGLKEMISYNKLQDVDEAFLSNEKLMHLVKK